MRRAQKERAVLSILNCHWLRHANPIKIFLVDDHKLVRDGIRAMLLGNLSFKVVATAGNAGEFFSKLDEAQPDICVLDIQLPGRNGIEIAEILKDKHPQI